MEIWKPIPQYEDTYEVSDAGNVRRIRLARGSGFMQNMRQAPNHYGYPRVSLCKANKPKQYLVHRLVAAAFIGPCPEHQEVNHIDGNKANPRIENLEYVTSQGNKDHAVNLGLMAFGNRTGMAKLNPTAVREIRALRSTGLRMRDIGEMYGVSRRTVGDVLNGKLWQHVL